MTRPYVSRRELEHLSERLSGRDRAIVGQVADLRLMSARQIQAVHFPTDEHDGERAAIRARQRVLERLARERLLARLERRIGGLRAGSASFLFALGPVGQRLLALDGARRRAYEPSLRFVDHTLAIGQLVVDLTLAQRAGQLELLSCQSEPRCWRQFSGLGGRQLLRPDAFVSLGVGDYELRWFVEVDRGSESVPTVLRKCRLYADYYQTGREQTEQGGVFPRVCWVVPNEQRAERLRRAIENVSHFPERLFMVTTETEALVSLGGVKT
jgi:hypothetical protein